MAANGGRRQGGRFATGCSGNPAGMKPRRPPQGHTGRPGAAEERRGRGADAQGGGAGPGRRRDGPALVSSAAGAALPGSTDHPGPTAPPDESGRGSCIVLPASGGGPWRGDTGRGRKLARLVSEHHKAVQLTENRGTPAPYLEEALGLVPGPG